MRSKETLVVTVAAVVLAIALTWPIAGRFASAGRIDSGDGRFSVWNVAWVAHAITTDPGQLFNANIFYPHSNALAFSEANLIAGLMAVPVWLLTKNPYAAQNFVILLAFVLSSVCTYALVRRLSGSRAAAAFSALAFSFCPYTFSHIPHIQLLMTWGIGIALLAFHSFIEAPSAWRSVKVGLALAICALACGYYGIFSALIVAVGFIWFAFLQRRWRDLEYLAFGGLAALVAWTLILPFLAHFMDVREAGFGRSLDDARLFSVRWRSYLASPMVVHRFLLEIIDTWRGVLFPGFAAIAMALVAVVRAAGRKPDSVPVHRHIVGFYLLVAVFGVWASLGPDYGLYALLHEYVPGFSFLRAPARFGVLLTMSVALLGGIGLASLQRTVPAPRRTVLVAVLLSVGLAESWPGRLGLVDAPEENPAYRMLGHLPFGPVAEFPYWSAASDRHRHTEYMLASTSHWKPLINGYSDHTPAEAFADQSTLAQFPALPTWRILRNHQARYIVMHYNQYPRDKRDATVLAMRELAPYLRVVVDAVDVSLYEIVGWPGGS